MSSYPRQELEVGALERRLGRAGSEPHPALRAELEPVVRQVCRPAQADEADDGMGGDGQDDPAGRRRGSQQPLGLRRPTVLI